MPLETYLKQINDYPLLSPEQEKELGRRVQQGDDEARQRFINSNLRLVVRFANSYAKGNQELLQELIQQGNMGLIRAVEKYDPERPNRFSSYAVWWIKAAIRGYLPWTDMIWIPASQKRLHKKIINKLLEEYEKQGVELSEEEFDEEIRRRGKSGRSWYAIKQGLCDGGRYETVSLHTKSPDEGGKVLEEVLEAEEDNAEEVAMGAEKAECVNRLIQDTPGMTAREQQVIRYIYGIPEENCIKKNRQEIGREYGLCRERIRQIERVAMQKLRRGISQEHRLLL